MSWIPNDHEVLAVLSLGSAERYKYFVSKIADEQRVWSLWQNGGWALASDDQANEIVPAWPHAKFSQVCATKEWLGYEPRPIELRDWIGRWLPGIEKDGRKVAVFPNLQDLGVVVDAGILERDLQEELSKY